MDVYIKNIEMPRSCWDCELGSAQQLDGRPCPFYSADYREQKKYSDKRADGCPLVPVPPHGRLIDADAVAKMVLDSVNQEDAQGFMFTKIICQILKDAPTIIPAEEGE